LTHIGYDSDIELAKILKPEWGVDMIIGGHSHTFLEQPAVVNNILITQAGVGTTHIGRFDIVVDDDTNSIIDYKWQLIPIEEGIAEPDTRLADFINSFATEVDRKYNTILCKFNETMTHPRREIETALGNLFADGLAEMGECNVMFVGSGSIRSKELGPVVTLKDYRACFPYDDSFNRFTVNGAMLKRMFAHFMRPENRTGKGEYYQVNGRIRATYNESTRELVALTFDGQHMTDDTLYTIGLAGYHVINSKYLDVTNDDLLAAGRSKVIATNIVDVLEEYLKSHQNIASKVEGRLAYV
jgi:5'-nucleotidase